MTTAAQAVSGEKWPPCVARQPILAKDEKVAGYEVVFGHLSDGPPSATIPHPAMCNAVDTVTSLGLDLLCDSRLAFIEGSEQMLLQDAFLALPADRVVLEVPLDITVNSRVIEACKRHRKKGYKIAIDHFRKNDHRECLVPLAEFLKVDAGSRADQDFRQIATAHAAKPCKLLAQNVASREDHRSAVKAGFTLFQGYFFHQPENMRIRQIPPRQVSRMRLLQAVAAPEIDFDLVDELIRQDAALCYRLLRYLNSPVLGFAVPVQSVRHAVALLGERALIQWVRTATAMSMGQPKCSDLALSSLVRARFCELIGPKVGHGDADLFLLGMFSLMDVILETSMEILVDGIAFDTSTKAALLAIKNGGGARLSPILELAAAREKGDWERVAGDAAKLNLPLASVSSAYIEAVQWAYELTRAANAHSHTAH